MNDASHSKDANMKYYLRVRVVILLIVLIPLMIYQVFCFGRVKNFAPLYYCKWLFVILIIGTMVTSKFKQ